MPPAELLEELRSSQPFLDDFPYEGIPDNALIYRIGAVLQAVLECLEGHEEQGENIEERLGVVYDYVYRYLSPLVIQVLMESRRLDIRTTGVNALVSGCNMVVTALLDHFEGAILSASWLNHGKSGDGNFSGEMASKYEEMRLCDLSVELGPIIGNMKKYRTIIGTQGILDDDRVNAAMDYTACLAEVSYIFGVIQEKESSENLQEKIMYIRGVLEELLEQSMSFFDSVGHLLLGEQNVDFVDRFLGQADDICMTIFHFLQTPRQSLDEERAFDIKIDPAFIPEYLDS